MAAAKRNNSTFIPRVASLIFAATLVFALITPAYAQDPSIVLQSTTSTDNSGLLKDILPKFKAATGITVHVVAVGTGQAIKNATRGDGDVLLVHARKAEEEFVAKGHGVKRTDVMYNDFIIVGPASDPAQISGIKDVAEALKKVASSKAIFASRGDDSGTHKAELRLWNSVGIDISAASGRWYRSTGSGMGATLNAAVAMNGYALTDRGTWTAFRNKRNHKLVVEGDPRLHNQYGIILVNPERHPTVKAKEGQAFIDWITGPEGQTAIKEFKVDGQQLFFPNAPTS